MANDQLVLSDEAYPDPLRALRSPPAILYVRGRLPTERPWIAIVGSRRATEAGRARARSIAADLARADVVVVSGGALGIDAAAHQGALDAGGRTVAVLPSPVFAPTPSTNRRLFDAIVRGGGALVSERDQPPRHRGDFAARNRIIAGLADAVIVVQAARRSGTRHTADAARRLGRPLLACRWRDGHPLGTGCDDLLAAGARPIEVDASAPIALDPHDRDGQQVVDGLRHGPRSVEALASYTGFDTARIIATLGRLELAGHVRGRAGGRFEICRDCFVLDPDYFPAPC